MSKLELKCEYCGISFLRQRSNVKQTKSNFCSKKCFSDSRKGINPFPEKKHERHFCNSKCSGKWKSIHILAEKSSNWKDGSYITIAKQLSSNKWANIRKSVIRLDNNKCALCKSDIKLEVHHIIRKGKNPALIFDITNLVTLCKKCHCGINGLEDDYIGIFSDIVANRMNCGKPDCENKGNPQPSSQSEKVQRLLEHSDMLNNQQERPTRKG